MKEKRMCLAKTLKGLEQPLADELKKLGFGKINVLKRAVEFETDLAGIYLANLSLRNAINVLIPFRKFHFKDNDEFYKRINEVPWEKWFDPKKTIMCRSTMYSEAFKHSNFPSLLAKDAIVDRFSKIYGIRPNVDRERPDIHIDVFVRNNDCVISLNSSGAPLYLRGYRNMPFSAPLNEVLAAGIVSLTGWDGKEEFYNPMCGSGTLVLEAGMMAANLPANMMRKEFSFMNWSVFDSSIFNEVKEKAISKRKDVKTSLLKASDQSNRAISITRNSRNLLDMEDQIELKKMEFMKNEPLISEGLVVLNPPYDERLELEDADDYYKKIGETIKENYKNFNVWVFTGYPNAKDAIGLKVDKKIDLMNGKIPCELLLYKPK